MCFFSDIVNNIMTIDQHGNRIILTHLTTNGNIVTMVTSTVTMVTHIQDMKATLQDVGHLTAAEGNNTVPMTTPRTAGRRGVTRAKVTTARQHPDLYYTGIRAMGGLLVILHHMCTYVQ